MKFAKEILEDPQFRFKNLVKGKLYRFHMKDPVFASYNMQLISCSNNKVIIVPNNSFVVFNRVDIIQITRFGYNTNRYRIEFIYKQHLCYLDFDPNSAWDVSIRSYKQLELI